jgi:hypothetical protein
MDLGSIRKKLEEGVQGFGSFVGNLTNPIGAINRGIQNVIRPQPTPQVKTQPPSIAQQAQNTFRAFTQPIFAPQRTQPKFNLPKPTLPGQIDFNKPETFTTPQIKDTYIGKEYQKYLEAKNIGDTVGQGKAEFNIRLESAAQRNPLYGGIRSYADFVNRQRGLTPEQSAIQVERQMDVFRGVPSNIIKQAGNIATGAVEAGQFITEKPAMYLQRKGGEFAGKSPQQITQQQQQYKQAGQNIKNYTAQTREDVRQFAADISPYYDKTGKAAQVGEQAAQIATSIGTAALPGGAFFSGASSYGRVYDEMTRAGATPDQANKAALIYSPIEAALEKFSVNRLIKPTSALSGVKRVLQNAVVGFINEGGTEGAQQLAENIIRKINGDTSIKSVWQGVPESVAIGGAIGSPISVVGGAVEAKAQNRIDRNRVEKAADTLVTNFVKAASPPADGSVQLNMMIGPSATGFGKAKQEGQVFLGAEGGQRFEITDKNSKLNLKDKVAAETVVTGYDEFGEELYEAVGFYKLGDILEHKELYKQYPQLVNTNVEFVDFNKNIPEGQPKDTASGKYDPQTNTILISKGILDDSKKPELRKTLEIEIKDIILHETQHNIQRIENWSKGGSAKGSGTNVQEYLRNSIVDRLYPTLKFKEASKKWSAIEKKVERSIKYKVIDYFNKYGKEPKGKNLFKMYEDLFPKNTPKNVIRFYSDFKIFLYEKGMGPYRQFAGEAEARQPGLRMNLSQAELDAMPKDMSRFQSTTDVPLNKLFTIDSTTGEFTNLREVANRYYLPLSNQTYDNTIGIFADLDDYNSEKQLKEVPPQIEEPATIEDLTAQNKNQIERQKKRYKKENVLRKFQRTWVDKFALATEIDRAVGVTKKADSLEAALDVASGNPDARLTGRLKQNGILGRNGLLSKYPQDSKISDLFHNYRILKFQQELNQQETGRKQIMRNENGEVYSPELIDQLVQDAEAKYPDFKKDTLKIKKVFDEMLYAAEDAGLLEKGTAKYVSSKFKYYANIDRVFPEQLLRPSVDMTPVGAVSRQKAVQTLTGGAAPIGTDWESTIDRLRVIERQIGMEKAGTILAKSLTKLQTANKKVRNRMLGTVIQSKQDVLDLRALNEELNQIVKLNKQLLTERRRARTNVRVQNVRAQNAAKLLTNQVKGKLRKFFPKELHPLIKNFTLQDIVNIAQNTVDSYTMLQTGVNPSLKGQGVDRNLQTFARQSKAHENFVSEWQQIRINMFENLQQGKNIRSYIQDIQPSTTTGLQTITLLDEGIPVKFEVVPEVAQMIQGYNEAKLDVLSQISKAIQRPFRWAFTGWLNPFFTVKSAILYDTPMSVINSPEGFKVFGPRAVAMGLKSIASNTKFQNALREAGAQMATGSLVNSQLMIDPKFEAAKKNLFKLARYTLTTRKGIKTLTEALDVFGGKVANMTRSRIAAASYLAAKKKGYSEADAIAEAAYAYNNVMPNYARTSSAMRRLDAWFMYSSASIAGTRAYGKSARQRPIRTLVYTSMFTAPVVATVALSLANMGADADDENKNFYTDMLKSGKDYVVDNNLIIVLPGATKNMKTGEWSGIVKIPVAPELRAANKIMWRTAYQQMTKQKVATPATYGSAIFNMVTGGVLDQPDNPFLNTLAGLLTDKNIRISQGTIRDITPEDLKRLPEQERYREDTPQIAKDIARQINEKSPIKISPIKIEYILNNFGITGRIIQNPSDIFKEAVNQFYGGKGKSEGAIYYEKLEQDKKSIPGWNYNDDNAYDSLHPIKKDSRGIDIWDDDVNIYNPSKRLSTYNQNPRVYELDKKQNERNIAEGKPGNPLFNLNNEQLRKVLEKEALPPGAKDPELDKLFNLEWYVDYRAEKKIFFEKLKELAAKEGWKFAENDNPYPETPPNIQAAMDAYNKLKKGTGDRSRWIRDNQELFNAMKAQWAAIDDWQNRQRAKRGLLPTEGFQTDATQQYNNQYQRRSYFPRFNQPTIPVSRRNPSTTVMRTGMGQQIAMRPGRVVVRNQKA